MKTENKDWYTTKEIVQLTGRSAPWANSISSSGKFKYDVVEGRARYDKKTFDAFWQAWSTRKGKGFPKGKTQVISMPLDSPTAPTEQVYEWTAKETDQTLPVVSKTNDLCGFAFVRLSQVPALLEMLR